MPSPLMQTVRGYIALTKPNIIWLLLVTTLPAMVLAQGGWPSTWLVVATLFGGALAAGSANAINQYADRDIDQRMARTRRRPLPRGMVSSAGALWFGLALGVVATVWMVAVVNLLSALLTLGAIGFYVIIYTYILKRRTTQNIVIGGAAGAAPALIGWTAVTGNMWSLEPIFMFLIVFWWTPPHFWALAIVLEDDYRAAGVPMLPVVQGKRATKVQIVFWAIMLTALTVLFAGVSGLGPIYLGTALIGGGLFIAAAVWLLRQPGKRGAFAVYKFSTYYLAALFLAVMADTLSR
ncbi:MAG: heme o synthase [Dehalococcoidia bacterium]